MATKKPFKERMDIIKTQLRGMNYTDVKEVQRVVNNELTKKAKHRIEELKLMNAANDAEIKELEKLVK